MNFRIRFSKILLRKIWRKARLFARQALFVSVYRTQLTYYKFPRRIAHGNEIHPLGQCRHINLLGFGRDLTCQ